MALACRAALLSNLDSGLLLFAVIRGHSREPAVRLFVRVRPSSDDGETFHHQALVVRSTFRETSPSTRSSS